MDRKYARTENIEGLRKHYQPTSSNCHLKTTSHNNRKYILFSSTCGIFTKIDHKTTFNKCKKNLHCVKHILSSEWNYRIQDICKFSKYLETKHISPNSCLTINSWGKLENSLKWINVKIQHIRICGTQLLQYVERNLCH